MANFLKALFGNYSKRELKRVQPIADKVLALEEKYAAMSESELKNMTAVLKERLAGGETTDDILPDAFAACLTLLCGDAEDARKQLRACARPRRTKRAFYQLIRRSKRPYEVH